MKFLLPLTVVAALAAGVANADCAKPEGNVTVPNGSKATKEEMLATQKAIKAYDAAVKVYGTCMMSEQDAEIARGGDKLRQDERDKIVARYSKLISDEEDKVKNTADKFNAELKAYRAKNPAT